MNIFEKALFTLSILILRRWFQVVGVETSIEDNEEIVVSITFSREEF